MDSVIRAAIVYGFILLLLRILGKRTLAEVTTFDVVLLLIVSEAAQPGLMNDDNSLINSMLVITTLLGLDAVISRVVYRAPRAQRWLQGTPLILVENGKVLHDRLDKEAVGVEDILMAARETQGLERLDQIKYAILERTGGISIIPRSSA